MVLREVQTIIGPIGGLTGIGSENAGGVIRWSRWDLDAKSVLTVANTMLFIKLKKLPK
jgi:hypothetical protein